MQMCLQIAQGNLLDQFECQGATIFDQLRLGLYPDTIVPDRVEKFLPLPGQAEDISNSPSDVSAESAGIITGIGSDRMEQSCIIDAASDDS